jgi:hypothetical protein
MRGVTESIEKWLLCRHTSVATRKIKSTSLYLFFPKEVVVGDMLKTSHFAIVTGLNVAGSSVVVFGEMTAI